MKKTKNDIIDGWIKKADRDLSVSIRELKLKEPLTDIICFHAQQAAEKYMKAFHVFLGIEFQKTHDIEDLVIVAGKKDPSLLKLKDSGAELSVFAVETRYPEFEDPSLIDAKNAVKVAEKFKRFVKVKILKNRTIAGKNTD